MVLSRLKAIGAPSEHEDDAGRAEDGSPLTFRHLLEDCRRAWGAKIAYQQKSRGTWRRMSFDELYRRSHDVAAGLIALGLKPGDRALIIGENSIDWISAYYGIVLAGGVGVPLYYELKPAEIAEMAARSDARMAFLSPKSRERFESHLTGIDTIVMLQESARPAADDAPSDGVPADLSRTLSRQVLSLEGAVAAATPASRDALAEIELHPDDLASIVFTSGTTAGMKGVTLTHRNFMANLQQVRCSIPLNSRDRIAIVLPVHHAFPFTMSLVVAPYIGGEVTFENDLRRIRDRMAEIKPTIFLGVPQLFEVMWRNIMHSIELQGRMPTFEKGMRIAEATKKRTGVNIGRIVFRELHHRLGGSLRFAVSGGAALNPQVALNFARIGLPIIQGWGLTEAAPVLAAQRWSPRKFYMTNYYEEHLGSVGPALEGVEIGLIDVPEKELYVHLHGEGEIVAKGDNVSPGYWKAPEATEVMKVGEWLRTGDVGSIDAEGNIWITGRSKFVIVLDSGEKIHPDEVEEKLERGAAIEDIAVIGRKVRGKTQGWAIVYPNRDVVLEKLGPEPATEQAVRRIVEAELHEHEQDVSPFKRPTDFMLSDLPLPRTMPLRKLARGQIAETYSFDPRRWEESWTEHIAAQTPPSSDDEADSAVAV